VLLSQTTTQVTLPKTLSGNQYGVADARACAPRARNLAQLGVTRGHAGLSRASVGRLTLDGASLSELAKCGWPVHISLCAPPLISVLCELLPPANAVWCTLLPHPMLLQSQTNPSNNPPSIACRRRGARARTPRPACESGRDDALVAPASGMGLYKMLQLSLGGAAFACTSGDGV
jgi:hypothetical protein